jgi:electron transport complex protein RnfC
LIDYCGGFTMPPARLVNGGPMMGQPLPSLELPVVKGTAGILALSAAEVGERPQSPCIRCGSCIDACPVGLVPLEMAALIRKDNLEGAARLGVADCIGCGSCSWICPSHIPLVQYFNYANGMLSNLEQEQRRNERTRILVEAHHLRLEKIAAAKQAAQATRKSVASKANPEKTSA